MKILVRFFIDFNKGEGFRIIKIFLKKEEVGELFD